MINRDKPTEEIRERWAQATVGPWEHAATRQQGVFIIRIPEACMQLQGLVGIFNAVAIAHAPEDIKALLSIIDEQKARIEELERERLSQEVPTTAPVLTPSDMAWAKAVAHKIVVERRVDQNTGGPDEQ